MTLYTLSIRRPVLATVFSLVIVLFGTLAYFNLGVREYPAVDPPIISVSTSYRGANAEVIAAQITEPLEERINGVEGIRTLTSISRDGRSTITVEFALGADLERAANDVRDRVSQAVGALPPDADPPRVSKADADGDPIVFLNIASDERELLELSAIAEDLFKERLQTIAGVARVDIWGDKRYAMRLWLDPAKLAAYQLTPLDVQRALTTQNVELPTGRIEGDNVELTVRMMGQVQTPEAFEHLIVKRTGDQLVRLGDVGRAELGAENERTVLMRDGTPMVGVVLRPLPGANYIAIVDEFYARVETIRPDLPPDLRLGIGFDQTTQIRDSVAEVQQTIFLALALVLLVIFLFLRDWRSTVVPIVVIPIALIGAFGVMALFGFSINVLTLLALVLAIGLVVDDAIVVLENIYAKIEEGYDPIQAGILGTKEIFFAVVATTLALVSVLLPIVFLPGLTGRLFREFGLVLMGAVMISSFVALTLTPMLATKLLKKRDVQPWFYRKTEPFFERLT
ncbi:MAG: efflux RND transporter permease subunit, partial [Bacteroidota bacterium]